MHAKILRDIFQTSAVSASAQRAVFGWGFFRENETIGDAKRDCHGGRKEIFFFWLARKVKLKRWRGGGGIRRSAEKIRKGFFEESVGIPSWQKSNLKREVFFFFSSGNINLLWCTAVRKFQAELGFTLLLWCGRLILLLAITVFLLPMYFYVPVRRSTLITW